MTGQKDGTLLESKVSINKIKNVFRILMEETPFLVDDKSIQEAEGRSEKE